ncbi:MAG: hypothetical protein ACRCTY_06600, partial [Candidatus Adiutrix sp.]
MEAAVYLQSLEPEPQTEALYEFFRQYDLQFNSCQQTSSYLTALTYMAENGEINFVSNRLKKLTNCLNLTEEERNKAAALENKLGVERVFTAKSQAAPPPSPTATTLDATLGAATTPTLSATPKPQPIGPSVTRKPSPIIRTALVEKPTLPARSLIGPPRPTQEQRPKETAQVRNVEFSSQHYYRDGDRGTTRLYMNTNTADITIDKLTFSAG